MGEGLSAMRPYTRGQGRLSQGSGTPEGLVEVSWAEMVGREFQAEGAVCLEHPWRGRS